MKKNLRGKRYLRSRATVKIGRLNRLSKKINRFISLLGRASKIMDEYTDNYLISKIMMLYEGAEKGR